MRTSRTSAAHRPRKGLTLLEVLLATAVFALSLVAIGELLNASSDQALEVQARSRAARLAESKLAEYAAGVRSLQGGGTSGDFELDGEPDWSYTVDVQADASATGLYQINVAVSRGSVTTTLSQFVFDPKSRGVVLSQQQATTSSSSGSSATPGSSSSSPQSPTTNSSSNKPTTNSSSGGSGSTKPPGSTTTTGTKPSTTSGTTKPGG